MSLIDGAVVAAAAVAVTLQIVAGQTLEQVLEAAAAKGSKGSKARGSARNRS
jgi:hypothetical protein